MSITIAAVGPDKREVASINWSNGNAAAVLGAIGIEDIWGVGAVAGAELGTWRQRIIRALNTDAAQGHTRAGFELRTTFKFGSSFIMHGLDVQGIHERLRALDGVLAQAQRLGLTVLVF